MKGTYMIVGIAIALSAATPVAAIAQQTGHQMAATPQESSTAIADCARAQAQLLRTIDAANTRAEAARQSNSAAAMRAAMDDIQGALSSLRAQLAACRELDKVAAADPHAGHVMPSAQQPQTPGMQPGSTTPAPAAPGVKTADPHAGHTMPPAPAAKPSAPTAKPPATTKPTADPHAGHAMPPPAAKPSATPTKPPAATKPTADPHAGHKTPAPEKPKPPATDKPKPTTPPAPMDHSKMPMGGTAPKEGDMPAATKGSPRLPVMPVERIADPACPQNVGDPKAPTAVYERKVYYFCSAKDRDEFRKDPAAYLKKRPR